MFPKSQKVNKSVETNYFIKKLNLYKKKDKPMTNIFLTWDRRKICGEVKLVLLYPNPPLSVVNGQKIKTQIDSQ